MSEWKEYRLGQVAKFQEGYVNPSQTVRDYFDGDIKWLRANDLNNSFVFNTSRTLTEKGFKSAGKSALLFKPDSIAISKSGTIGRLGILKDFMCGNRAVINIEPNRENFNSLFIFYTLKNKHNEIVELAQGSVQKNLYIPVLKELKIKVPNIEIQRNIAEILSSLDDKIELNNKINQELESLAQLLFKRWFVDFEFPNENGEPYKSSGGEMVDSELGEIPSCFTINNIKDFGEVICGKTPAKSNKEYYGDDIPFVKIPDMHKNVFVTKTEDSLSFKGANSQKNKTLEAGTVILSSIATVGLVSIISRKSQTNQQINAIVPIKSHLTNFLYLLLKSKNQDFQQLASGGSTTLNMNTSTFKNYKVINPSEILLIKFNDIIDCLFKEIYNNIEESYCLMKMRDTILPKLISGELQINDN